MTFQPLVNQELTIDGTLYRVAEHPAARGVPYGQEGRQGTVYCIVGPDGERRALKVFKPRFRVPSMVSLAKRLAFFADLPGLSVCRRTVLTPQHHASLLREFPDLLYGVVMPWIEGPTWMETVVARREVTVEQSLGMARSLAIVLAGMEQEGLAHCDLSGPNILLPVLGSSYAGRSDGLGVALVDVEQMYGPDLKKPENVPGGSPGYAHKTAPEGMWETDADRLAGAVVLAEMLAWWDPEVRAASWGESFFDPAEMQTSSSRAGALYDSLRGRWGDGVVQVFDRAWRSETLSECPTFGEWLVVLPDSVGTMPSRQAVASVPSPSELKAAIEAADTGPVDPIVRELMDQAEASQGDGDLSGALALYKEARSLSVEGSRLSKQLALIIDDLGTKVHGQRAATAATGQAPAPPPGEDETDPIVDLLVGQAADFEEEGRLEAALQSYREAISLLPSGSPMGQELDLIAHGLEERMQAASPPVVEPVVPPPPQPVAPPPPLAEEAPALPVEEAPAPVVAHDTAPVEQPPAPVVQAVVQPNPPAEPQIDRTVAPVVAGLMEQARELEQGGDLKEALATYREAHSLVPENSPSSMELDGLIAGLEARLRESGAGPSRHGASEQAPPMDLGAILAEAPAVEWPREEQARQVHTAPEAPEPAGGPDAGTPPTWEPAASAATHEPPAEAQPVYPAFPVWVAPPADEPPSKPWESATSEAPPQPPQPPQPELPSYRPGEPEAEAEPLIRVIGEPEPEPERQLPSFRPGDDAPAQPWAEAPALPSFKPGADTAPAAAAAASSDAVELDPIVWQLVDEAHKLDAEGQPERALATYREAQSLVPERSEFGQELAQRVRELEGRLRIGPRVVAPLPRDEGPRVDAYPPDVPRPGFDLGAALAQVPDAPPRPAPQGQGQPGYAPYPTSAGEQPPPGASGIQGGALDTIYDMGLRAYNRGDWDQAGQLLREVVKRQPGYQRDGQLASSLLMEVERQAAGDGRPGSKKGKSKDKDKGKQAKPLMSVNSPSLPTGAEGAQPSDDAPPSFVPASRPARKPTATSSRKQGTPGWVIPVAIAAVVVILLLAVGGFLLLSASNSAARARAQATSTAQAVALLQTTATAVAQSAGATQEAVMAMVTQVAQDARQTATAQAQAFDTKVKAMGLLKTLEGHTQDVRTVAFSPDGKTLASGSYDHSVILWKTGDWSISKVLTGSASSIIDLAFSPDGKTVAAAADDGKIWLWGVADNKARQFDQQKRAWSVAFSPDGKTLATGTGLGGNDIRLWNVADGKLLHKVDLPANPDPASNGSNYIRGLAFSPDGKTLATGSEDSIIRLWKTSDASTILTLKGHTGAVYSLAYSPDGKLLASGSADKTVRLWSMPDGAPLLTLKGHSGSVTGVAFSPDGKLVAGGSSDGTIDIWSVKDGSLLTTLTEPSDKTTSVAFSPDGKVLVSGSGSGGTPPDGKVRVWGVPAGK